MAGTESTAPRAEQPHKPGDKATVPEVQQQAATAAADALRQDAGLTGKRPEAVEPARTTAAPTSTDLVTASVNTLNKAQGADQILAVLQGKSAAERQSILEGYRGANNSDLTADLAKKGVTGADYTRVITAIRRRDGATDSAGAIERSLATLGAATDPAGRAQSERQLRDNVSTLSTKELQELDQRLKQNHDGQGLQQFLLDNQNLSAGTRKALELQIYGASPAPAERTLQGADYRATHPEVSLALAQNALANKDIAQFQEAMRNAPESARQQFAQGQDGVTGDQRLAQAFSGSELDRARDFVNRGGVSLESLVTANDRQFLFWRMQGGIDVALKGARPEDVDSYRRGQTLAANGGDTSTYSAEQKRDRDFYDSLHERLKQAFPEPGQLVGKEDILLNNGSFVGRYAAGTTPNDRFSAIEHMSEADRQKLIASPDIRAQLDRALGTLAPGAEGDRARQLLERKLSAPDEAAASKVGRTVSETLGDNPPPPYHHGAVLDSLARMSGDEAKKYREDAQFKADLDNRLKSYLGERDMPVMGAANNWTDPQMRLATRMTEALAKGQDPTADPTNRVLLQALRATDGSNRTFDGIAIQSKNPQEARGISQAIEQIFKDDPALAARVKANPNSDEARNFTFALRVEAGAAKPPLRDFEFGPMINRFYREGHLNLDDRMRFAQSPEDKYRAVVETSSQAERAMLLQPDASGDARALQERVFGNFDADHRAVLTNALKAGNLDATDRARLAVLDGSVTATNMGTILKDQNVSQIKAEYARRYARDLDADGQAKASAGERLAVQELLSSTRTASGDQFINRQGATDSRTGGSFFNSDGDVANLEASRNNIARMLTQNADQTRLAGDAEYQRRIGAMDDAINQYDKDQNRTREARDQAIQATIQAAVFASAVFTEGATLPIALSFAGATFTAAMSNDTDPWSRTKNFAKGLVDSAVMAIPGSQLGAMLRISEGAAGVTAARVAGSNLLREGAQAEVQSSLQGLSTTALRNGTARIPHEEYTRVASTLAKPGATQEEIARLATTLQTEFQTAVNKGAADYFTTAVQLREAAKVGGVSSAIAGTINGAIDYDPSKSIADNLKRIGTNATVGAIEGAGMTVAFGYGVMSARGILRRGVDGNLTVRAEGNDAQKLEVVSTGADGRQTVRALEPNTETVISPTDQLRLKAANDNGTAPEPRPTTAQSLLPPVEIVSTEVQTGPRAANDNPRPITAANDNHQWRQEPMVVNGNPQIMASGRDETPRRNTLRLATNNGNDVTTGDLSRTSRTERPTSERPGERTTSREGRPPLDAADLKAALGANAEALARLDNTPLKPYIDWLRAHSGETDPKAFSDMILLKHRLSNEGGPALTVPLERMQDANPATMRFIRDRMMEASKAFDVPATAQHGMQYEYAADRMLMERFSGTREEPVSVRDTDAGRTHSTLNANLRDWIYIPGAQGSPMDHAKVDGMFINVRDGRFVPVDIKNNTMSDRKAGNANNFLNLTFESNGTNRPIDPRTGLFRTEPDASFVTQQLARALDATRSASQSVNVSAFGPNLQYPDLRDRTNSEMGKALRDFMAQAARSEDPFVRQWGARVQNAETYFRLHEKPNERAEGVVPDPAVQMDLAATPQLRQQDQDAKTIFANLRPLDTSLKENDGRQLLDLREQLTARGVQASDADLLAVYSSTRRITNPDERAQARQRVAQEFADARKANGDISFAEVSKLSEYRAAFGDSVTLDQVRSTERILDVYRDLKQTPPSREDAFLGVLDNHTPAHAAVDAMRGIKDEIVAHLDKAKLLELNLPKLNRFLTPGSKFTDDDAKAVLFALDKHFVRMGLAPDLAKANALKVMETVNRALRPTT